MSPLLVLRLPSLPVSKLVNRSHYVFRKTAFFQRLAAPLFVVHRGTICAASRLEWPHTEVEGKTTLVEVV